MNEEQEKLRVLWKLGFKFKFVAGQEVWTDLSPQYPSQKPKKGMIAEVVRDGFFVIIKDFRARFFFYTKNVYPAKVEDL